VTATLGLGCFNILLVFKLFSVSVNVGAWY
jgi:hypothetical protein